MVLRDGVPEGAPDCAINRSRDWELARRLESEGTVVSNPSEVCRVFNDKLLTYELADRAGVPHMPVSLPGEPLPPGPPWVVKSRSGHGGSEVALARDEAEVRGLVGTIGDPLVQSMADPGRDMRAYVLGDEIVACVMRSSDSDFRANHSLGGKAELCDPPEGIEKMVADVCRGLSPDLVGVDFVFRDGEPLLNEAEDAVGCRMLYELTGLDPARLLVERVHSKISR